MPQRIWLKAEHHTMGRNRALFATHRTAAITPAKMEPASRVVIETTSARLTHCTIKTQIR